MISLLTVGVEPDVGRKVGFSVVGTSVSAPNVGEGVTMRGAEVGAHVHRSTTCDVGFSVFSAPRDRRGLDWPFVEANRRAGRSSQRARRVTANFSAVASSHAWECEEDRQEGRSLLDYRVEEVEV